MEVKLLSLPPTLQFSSTAPRLGNFGRTAIAPDQTSHPRRLLSFTPWELLWRNRYPGSLVVANQVARLFCHIRGKMLGGVGSLLQKCSLSLQAEPGFKVKYLRMPLAPSLVETCSVRSTQTHHWTIGTRCAYAPWRILILKLRLDT